MFYKFSIAIILAILLSACAGNQVKYSQMPIPEADPDHALIYIYRTTNHALALRTVYFNIDDVELAELNRGNFTWIKVPAGSHDFSFNWAWDVSFGRKTGKVQTFEGGKTYYYRFNPGANIIGALMYFTSVMVEVTDVEAAQEMNNLDYKAAKTSAAITIK
ncbi:DUF2846 domain-containing protein [Methylobacillus sp. Pita2]|uniref:DUF2846 domain-containing protein n=1 Tax=Methylobacillus sp. Pita2 TaxID=3383245 RepID=UPI0038B4B697